MAFADGYALFLLASGFQAAAGDIVLDGDERFLVVQRVATSLSYEGMTGPPSKTAVLARAVAEIRIAHD